MNNLDEIRTRLAAEFPVFANSSEIMSCYFIKFTSIDNLLKSDIATKPVNYYMTDPISRASVTMAKCVESKQEREKVA